MEFLETMKIKSVPFIDSKNILHYWDKGILKTFDLSNENVKKQAIINPKRKGIGRTENGIFFKEYLPKDVCKALLKTGEYIWTMGDKFNDHRADVYHKCWEVNKDKPNFENIEHCGNVASNPCYGRIRYKLEEGYTKPTECPRCEATYAIYNTYKPLKWKLWDSLLWVRDFFHWRIFHNIYKDAETFFFAKSKHGRAILKGWQEVITNESVVGELTFWRKHYFKPIIKNSNLAYYENGGEWIIYNPELYDKETVEEMVKKNEYNVIWEYEDWVRTKNGIKILHDKDWGRGSF